MGFSIIVAMVLRRLTWGEKRLLGRPAIQLIFAAALASGLVIATASQNLIWKSDIALGYRGVAVAPTNANAWNTLGRGLGQVGLYYEAGKAFQQALRLEPHFPDPVYNLALIHFREGRTLIAQWYAIQATKIAPRDSRGFMLFGYIRTQLGHLDEAVQLMRQAIELSPDAAEYHYELGRVLKMRGDLSAALEEFKAELVHYPENPAARQEVAEIESSLKTHPANNPAGASTGPPHPTDGPR